MFRLNLAYRVFKKEAWCNDDLCPLCNCLFNGLLVVLISFSLGTKVICLYANGIGEHLQALKGALIKALIINRAEVRNEI